MVREDTAMRLGQNLKSFVRQDLLARRELPMEGQQKFCKALGQIPVGVKTRWAQFIRGLLGWLPADGELARELVIMALTSFWSRCRVKPERTHWCAPTTGANGRVIYACAPYS